MLEQIQGDAAQTTEVLGPVALADTPFIFAETHVQLPMQIVFDAPVAANVSCQAFGPRPPIQRTNVVGQFDAGMAVDLPRALHQDQALDPRPL